jgi:hypothetical protein
MNRRNFKSKSTISITLTRNGKIMDRTIKSVIIDNKSTPDVSGVLVPDTVPMSEILRMRNDKKLQSTEPKMKFRLVNGKSPKVVIDMICGVLGCNQLIDSNDATYCSHHIAGSDRWELHD